MKHELVRGMCHFILETTFTTKQHPFVLMTENKIADKTFLFSLRITENNFLYFYYPLLTTLLLQVPHQVDRSRGCQLLKVIIYHHIHAILAPSFIYRYNNFHFVHQKPFGLNCPQVLDQVRRLELWDPVDGVGHLWPDTLSRDDQCGSTTPGLSL